MTAGFGGEHLFCQSWKVFKVVEFDRDRVSEPRIAFGNVVSKAELTHLAIADDIDADCLLHADDIGDGGMHNDI
jgi:hypothetical protein